MDSENDNQEVFYCHDDGEFRVYFTICDKLWIKQFYKNHWKSQTLTNNIREREQLNK